MEGYFNRSREMKILWAQWNFLRIYQETLCQILEFEDGQTKCLQAVVPTSIFPQIPPSIDDLAYLGVTKITAKLWEQFY